RDKEWLVSGDESPVRPDQAPVWHCKFIAGLFQPCPLLQDAYVRRQIAAQGHSQRYWRLMGLLMAQFDGLCKGFWASCASPAQNMTYQELYLLQSIGDLYDLKVLFPPD
ncbi:phospholipase B-like, partial [Haematococcus lacustris]